MTNLNSTENVGLVPRSDAAAVSGLDFLRRLLDGTYPRPPFSKETDIWPVAIEAGRVTFEASHRRAFTIRWESSTAVGSPLYWTLLWAARFIRRWRPAKAS